MYNCINISSNTETFQYMVEYKPSEEYRYLGNLGYEDLKDECILQINPSITRDKNTWFDKEFVLSKRYLPSQYKSSKVRLYFPIFSVDTYQKGIYYAFSIGTWIHDKYVSLGTYVFNRLDICALEKIITKGHNKYYECIDFDIVDPLSLIYSDDWNDFRTKICKEVKIDGYTVNNTVSTLFCTLYPVKKVDDIYIKIDDFDGGYTSIPISTINEHLRLNLRTNVFDELRGDSPSFICEISYNSIYNDLNEYLKETYGISKYKLNYELVVGNETDLYAVISQITDKEFCKFDKNSIHNNFKNREGWKEGINIKASVSICTNDGEELLYLLSNSIPFTEDILGFFTLNDFTYRRKPLYWVDLTSINMKNYQLTIPNKIQNTTIQINKPENVKNNLIQPRFFRVNELANITIHPDVTENICLNLDAYKSLVGAFLIKIEGCSFKEIGRTNAGVVFKISGGSLPRKKSNGVYYILDENSEMITSGKYIYE